MLSLAYKPIVAVMEETAGKVPNFGRQSIARHSIVSITGQGTCPRVITYFEDDGIQRYL